MQPPGPFEYEIRVSIVVFVLQEKPGGFSDNSVATGSVVPGSANVFDGSQNTSDDVVPAIWSDDVQEARKSLRYDQTSSDGDCVVANVVARGVCSWG